MMYQFKVGPETIWFIVVAVITTLAQLVATQGSTPPTDWKVWLVSLIAALTRTILGAILHLMGSQP